MSFYHDTRWVTIGGIGGCSVSEIRAKELLDWKASSLNKNEFDTRICTPWREIMGSKSENCELSSTRVISKGIDVYGFEEQNELREKALKMLKNIKMNLKLPCPLITYT